MGHCFIFPVVVPPKSVTVEVLLEIPASPARAFLTIWIRSCGKKGGVRIARKGYRHYRHSPIDVGGQVTLDQ